MSDVNCPMDVATRSDVVFCPDDLFDIMDSHAAGNNDGASGSSAASERSALATALTVNNSSIRLPKFTPEDQLAWFHPTEAEMRSRTVAVVDPVKNAALVLAALPSLAFRRNTPWLQALGDSPMEYVPLEVHFDAPLQAPRLPACAEGLTDAGRCFSLRRSLASVRGSPIYLLSEDGSEVI